MHLALLLLVAAQVPQELNAAIAGLKDVDVSYSLQTSRSRFATPRDLDAVGRLESWSLCETDDFLRIADELEIEGNSGGQSSRVSQSWRLWASKKQSLQVSPGGEISVLVTPVLSLSYSAINQQLTRNRLGVRVLLQTPEVLTSPLLCAQWSWSKWDSLSVCDGALLLYEASDAVSRQRLSVLVNADTHLPVASRMVFVGPGGQLSIQAGHWIYRPMKDSNQLWLSESIQLQVSAEGGVVTRSKVSEASLMGYGTDFPKLLVSQSTMLVDLSDPTGVVQYPGPLAKGTCPTVVEQHVCLAPSALSSTHAGPEVR